MRIIRRHELTDKVGYCLAHIYRLERAGLFPQRVHLGPRAVRWVRRRSRTGFGIAWTRVIGDRNSDLESPMLGPPAAMTSARYVSTKAIRDTVQSHEAEVAVHGDLVRGRQL